VLEEILRYYREGFPAARQALIAQMVEHVLGKNGVMGSIPIEGSVAVFVIIFIQEKQNGEAEI
jgi:hypothetical protein